MKNTEKTMEKIVACVRTGDSYSPAVRSMAALPTAGTTVPGRGDEEQCQAGLVEEIRPGESLQRGTGLRHFDESPGVGGQRPRIHLQRSSD